MDVSRETQARLEAYVAHLVRWNRSINIIGRSMESDIWKRHVADSAQLDGIVGPDTKTWCDLGSGGGFPAIVISILRPAVEMTLIEADRRKGEFLRSVIRDLGLSAVVVNERIETAPPANADVVSARALAPLPRLLDLALRHGQATTRYVFPKGSTYRKEIREAQEDWSFSMTAHPSTTEEGSVILELEHVVHV